MSWREGKITTRFLILEPNPASKSLSYFGRGYIFENVQEQPEKEQELIRLTGTKIVPTFLFQKKGFLGRKKQVIIGFEQNREQIEEWTGLKK